MDLEEVAKNILAKIGKFNVREKKPLMTLEGQEKSDGVVEFVEAAYAATSLLCMIWPYGGKERVRANHILFFDKLILSVFSMDENFDSLLSTDMDLSKFILTNLQKVKVVVKKTGKTVHNPHFLKTVWEHETVNMIHQSCYSVVSTYICISIHFFVFLYIFLCLHTYICVLKRIYEHLNIYS